MFHCRDQPLGIWMTLIRSRVICRFEIYRAHCNTCIKLSMTLIHFLLCVAFNQLFTNRSYQISLHGNMICNTIHTKIIIMQHQNCRLSSRLEQKHFCYLKISINVIRFNNHYTFADCPTNNIISQPLPYFV